MKRVAIVVSVLAILGIAIYFALGNQVIWNIFKKAGVVAAANPTIPAGEISPTEVPVVKSTDEVVTEGKLVPFRFVNLSFNTGGLVHEVLVTEGDTVKEGQMLVRLSNQEQLQAAVTAAELEVLNAQQSLDALYRDAPLKAAEALQELVNAPIAVQDAERQVNNLKFGTVSQDDIDIARANLTLSENKVKAAEDVYRPYENKPDSQIKAALLSKLAQARKEYEAAKNRLNNMLGTASDTQITQAEADLALARVKQAEAERAYEILKNGPNPDEVALAKARLENAQAGLAAAQAALGNLELTAPFTGTVVSVDLKVGEYVAPGVPLLLLVDFSTWRVETTNLTELNVVRINPGDMVRITFDALPGQEFPGMVERIKAVGQNQQGDITYTVIIDLKKFDPKLLWNMTCTAVINTKKTG